MPSTQKVRETKPAEIQSKVKQKLYLSGFNWSKEVVSFVINEDEGRGSFQLQFHKQLPYQAQGYSMHLMLLMEESANAAATPPMVPR